LSPGGAESDSRFGLVLRLRAALAAACDRSPRNHSRGSFSAAVKDLQRGDARAGARSNHAANLYSPAAPFRGAGRHRGQIEEHRLSWSNSLGHSPRTMPAESTNLRSTRLGSGCTETRSDALRTLRRAVSPLASPRNAGCSRDHSFLGGLGLRRLAGITAAATAPASIILHGMSAMPFIQPPVSQTFRSNVGLKSGKADSWRATLPIG